jgi:hypothetical protein
MGSLRDEDPVLGGAMGDPSLRRRLVAVLVGLLTVGLGLGAVDASAYAAPTPDRPGQQQPNRPGGQTGNQPGNQSGNQPGNQPGNQGARGPAGQDCPPGERCPEEKPPPDTEPPAAPALGEPVVKPKGRISLPVLAEERSRIEVRDGEEVVAGARATGQPQDLTWTAKTGTYTYTVTATDREDNQSPPATATVEVDADPPVLQRFVVTPGDARAPESLVAFVTEPETAYSLFVDGKQIAEGTTPESGSRQVRRSLDLADGRYPVEVRLEDETGNRSRKTKPLVVRIGALFLDAELTTGPTDPEQVVEVRATPGTRGTVRFPEGQNTTFAVDERGEALVRLELDDGTYDDGSVVVRDVHGRRGSASLPEVVVDTTPPVLEAAPIGADLAEGLMSLEVTADPGSLVSWRVLDPAGSLVTSGRYVASSSTQVLSRDLDKGAYTVEMSTTDVFDRATEVEVTVDVAADPLSRRTVLAVLAVLLLLLVAGAVVLARMWRRRRGESRDRRGHEAVPATPESLAAYERAEAAWNAQHLALSRLAQVARGQVPQDVVLPPGFALMPDEKALWCTGARLLHVAESDGQEVALEGEAGHLVVTDQRFAFTGPQTRDWWHPMVVRVRHLDHARTLVATRDVAGWAGFAYDEPELTRPYIDLVGPGVRNGSYVGMLERGLRDHDMRRPSPPV